MPGSSPLTRGKRGTASHRQLQCRLIPAHAGKTESGSTWDVDLSAHPRSRGENRRPRPHPRQDAGSSPLTRGKREAATLDSHSERLIPAHAGKTLDAIE